MEDALLLRKKAEEARRRADLVASSKAAAALREMADEYDAQARKLEGSLRDSKQ
jgi:hypothetical protein